MINKEDINFPIFFLAYAHSQGWSVPDFQLETCEFLESFYNDPDTPIAVLMLHRGAGKSTMLNIWNGYMLYKNNDELIFHQGATDADANKCSRGTQQVLEQHPFCKNNTVKESGEIIRWWVTNAKDKVYGSFFAKGILSNVTGARSTFIENDDIEVPSNTDTEEKRDKLRFRLTEQTHILIPNGKKLFIGTPHANDSLYYELIRKGAKALIKKMFEHEARFTEGKLKVITSFEPINVFSGIGETAKLLMEYDDYIITQINDNTFETTLNERHMLLDIYSEAMWADRFTIKEMTQRRKECNNIGEWDSQYQMHNVSITDVRLDPSRLIEYDLEVSFNNGGMWLGENQIVSATLQLDPSSGKTKSDVSSTALVLQDIKGRLYWHRSINLTGEIIITDEKGSNIIGGQVMQLCDIIEEFRLPRIIIETNGVGTHVPSTLRSALKQRNIVCGVTEQHATKNKNIRIISAIESPLMSGYLYAHKSVLKDNAGNESIIVKKFKAFDPSKANNKDDEMDSLAGAISAEPIRIGMNNHIATYDPNKNWMPNNRMGEVTIDFD